MTSQRVLVTGGAGFIGSHLVGHLVHRGHRVVVIDSLVTGDKNNLQTVLDAIEFIHGDLRDEDACRNAVRGVDTVYHVAALPSVPRSLENPWASHDANVNGTMRLLTAAMKAGVRRLIYSGSSSTYGDTPILPKRESSEPLPRSPYAAAKLAGEQYVLSFARAGLIEGIALRYFNVFGPRQDPESAYAAVIPLFMRAAYEDCPATVFGDGLQTRDFTYVSNVVEANVLAAGASGEKASGVVVNVGGGQRISLLMLVELIGQVAGRPLRYKSAPPRAGDVQDSLADLNRAAEVIGYRPSVDLEEGLRRTWTWFLEQRSADGGESNSASATRFAAAD